MSTEHGKPRARHAEAQLAREIGTSPMVELHCMVKVRAGQVIGIFVGPNDAAEVLRVKDFSAGSAFEEGTMRFGKMHGVSFFLLEDDLP